MFQNKLLNEEHSRLKKRQEKIYEMLKQTESWQIGGKLLEQLGSELLEINTSSSLDVYVLEDLPIVSKKLYEKIVSLNERFY